MVCTPTAAAATATAITTSTQGLIVPPEMGPNPPTPSVYQTSLQGSPIRQAHTGWPIANQGARVPRGALHNEMPLYSPANTTQNGPSPFA